MTIAELANLLGSTELFRSVEASLISTLAAGVDTLSLHDGEVLVREGDADQNLYLVIAGRLRVCVRNERNKSTLLHFASTGESVCEMGILADDLASATIDAVGPTQVARLPRTAFDRFSAMHPAARLLITQSLSRQLQRNLLSLALHRSSLFSSLDPDVLRDLEGEFETFLLYGGETLFREGDPGDFLCIVVSGRLRVVVRRGDGQDNTMTELASGEIVGEMAVVTGERRTATIDAIRDTQLAKLTKASFERFLSKHGRAAVEVVVRKLAERLRDTTAGRHGQRNISTVAMIPAHTTAPAGDFCERLTAALSKFGSTLHLTGARVNEHLGQEDIVQTYELAGGNFRIVAWLSNQELTHSYVLYEADPFLSPWTERCIRQADHILVVADADADPAPGDIETELLHPHDGRYIAPQWLVLVHGENEPSGTVKWLDTRHVERHFHVRLSDPTTVERLARFLTGRALGLTLGGGFARGLAHAGVFRALADLGVPVDAIGGASMGALVGGLRAMGWDCDKIIRETCAACAGAFGDLTFPFIAFKTGRTFSEAVRKLYGDIQIEDLWLPFFCISANLNRSELKVHTRGSLAKAILAGTRAPGVFPPIVYEGELHVDGGVINNVPVDIMKTFSNNGIAVGVDVSPPHELHVTKDYGDVVLGWAAFWNRFNPFSRKRVYTPSILLVMIRTLEFSGIAYKNIRIEFADVYLYPNLLKFKRTDFHLAPQIAQAGYDAARANMLEWIANSSVAAAKRPDLARTATEEESRQVEIGTA
jgi:NTE family protein/lysophospholipid hydrolase